MGGEWFCSDRGGGNWDPTLQTGPAGGMGHSKAGKRLCPGNLSPTLHAGEEGSSLEPGSWGWGTTFSGRGGYACNLYW